MLHTTDEWRETECFTPLINNERDENINNIDEWTEAECFTSLMNGVKRNALHH